MIVLRRCAMKMHVRFIASSRSDSMTLTSVRESRELVASSHTNRRGFLSTARAIATRCFSPPLSFRPRSPTKVSYCCGIRMMVSWSSDALAALSTSAGDASGQLYAMLLKMVSLNRGVS
mmetsp:Transcript_4644/g.16642  ORF Transcript_4644/g.16642 Transcript_4644/m.16642 type:complete len:119 (+) Transcript_4644:319-675(+)